MGNIILFIFVFTSLSCFGATQRFFQDAKLPTQQMVEKQSFTNPAAAGASNVLSSSVGNTSGAAATVTTFVAQPDVPRTLVLVANQNFNDVAACTVTVTGTNFFDRIITQLFTFVANDSRSQTSGKAFKTVTSVAFPASCEDSPYGATWSLGFGEALGIKRCMGANGDFLHSTLNGAKEATAPTIVSDSDEVEKNIVDFNGTMNGSNDFNLFFFQNYGCHP